MPTQGSVLAAARQFTSACSLLEDACTLLAGTSARLPGPRAQKWYAATLARLEDNIGKLKHMKATVVEDADLQKPIQ